MQVIIIFDKLIALHLYLQSFVITIYCNYIMQSYAYIMVLG